MPHWGFQDGELPQYGPCEDCGETLRIDRKDLIAEHLALCDEATVAKRMDAVLDLVVHKMRRVA